MADSKPSGSTLALVSSAVNRARTRGTGPSSTLIESTFGTTVGAANASQRRDDQPELLSGKEPQ